MRLDISYLNVKEFRYLFVLIITFSNNPRNCKLELSGKIIDKFKSIKSPGYRYPLLISVNENILARNSVSASSYPPKSECVPLKVLDHSNEDCDFSDG